MQLTRKIYSIIMLFLLILLVSATTSAQEDQFPPRDVSVPGGPDAETFAQPLGLRAPPKSFNVNTRADSVDFSPYDNECKDPNNLCSLRAAIMQSNLLEPGSTIYLPSGTYKLSLDTLGVPDWEEGDLDIHKSVTIIGEGAGTTIIDGLKLDRVMEISGSSVTLRFLALKNGTITAGGSTGGALRIVGGSNVTLNAVTIADSTANYGGGIDVQQSTLTVLKSTVANNTATITGGGITVFNGENSSILNLDTSTISGNRSGYGGGGLEINNNTTSTFTSVTVAKNTSGTTAASGGGGILSSPSITINLSNSLIVDNVANGSLGQQNCAISGASIGVNMFTTDGTNMFSNKSGCTGTAADKTGNPALLPLAINGPGQSPTHALPAGDTVAIDQGSPTCDTANFDQRGISRVQGAACDIGAFEFTIEYVRNGDFETFVEGSSVIPANWKLIRTTTPDRVRCNTAKKTFAVSRNCMFQFRADVPYKGARLQQRPDFTTMHAGDTLLMTGFVRGQKVTANTVRLQTLVIYTDGTRSKITLFAPEGNFQYKHFYDGLEVKNVPIKRVKVMLKYSSGAGKAFFDAISLVKDSSSVAALSPELNSAIPPSSIQNVEDNLLPLPPEPFDQ